VFVLIRIFSVTVLNVEEWRPIVWLEVETGRGGNNLSREVEIESSSAGGDLAFDTVLRKAGKNPIFSEKKIGFLVFGAKTRWFLVFPLPVTPILVSERPAGNTRQHNSLTYKTFVRWGSLWWFFNLNRIFIFRFQLNKLCKVSYIHCV
jgi:hypothetical protein